jgi:transposase
MLAAPMSKFCLDTFHIVQCATNALDKVRREIWNQARRAHERGLAKIIKGSRYALSASTQRISPTTIRRVCPESPS